MEHVRKFSTEQLQAKIEDKEMKLFLNDISSGKINGTASRQETLSARGYTYIYIWQTSMIRSVRNSSIGFSKSTRNKPENQDKDAQGKIEQQQALSFGKCSQHEWEPQMMSKEKGTSIKVGTQKG